VRLLTFDTSTHVGWALFAHPHRLIAFDTWELPPPIGVDPYAMGSRWLAFENWVDMMLIEHRPQVVAFEAPISPNMPFATSNTLTMRLLHGLTVVVELCATRGGVRCIEVPNATAKTRMTGNQHAKKPAMIAAALALGHLVADDNQADAIGVGLATYEHLGIV
jgi:Holliday junction resolvasome RuvABC endonuclease subunit